MLSILKESIKSIILNERAQVDVQQLKRDLVALEQEAKRSGVYLELYLSKGHVMLGYIKRETAAKGIGQKFIASLMAIAKQHNVPIGLDVDVGDIDPIAQDRLISYYKRLGFTFNSAEYKRDPDLGVFMTSGMERKPMMYWNNG